MAGEPADPTKAAYSHAFVVLAAAAASVAERTGGHELLGEALDVMDRWFWQEGPGMVVDAWSRDFSILDGYRGINANMHSVEAFLAAADALERLGDKAAGELWRARAGRVVERTVHGFAREAGWRLPEHFTEAWEPLPDYNIEDRAHPFRPYGVTPGHLLEWSRLSLHVWVGEHRTTGAPGAPAVDGERSWLLGDAQALYERAVADGWKTDGPEGFVYTTDHHGAVSAPARLHWVVAEAIGASAALFQATGEQRYADDHARWWSHAQACFIDQEGGSWHSALDADGQPSTDVWAGKPDVYHTLQATLVPRLPMAPTFAAALRAQGPRGSAS